MKEPIDVAVAFARLGRIHLGDTDMAGVLAQVAGVAGDTVPGADEVSVTLLDDGRARTVAATGDGATAIDEWQYRQGSGPCLAAAAAKATVSVPDVAADTRWPDWAAQALSHGAGSSLSIGLPIQDKVAGALNIYAHTSRAFDDDAILVAQTFAGYAAVALSNAHLYETAAALARHMQAAMESRAVIEQAKGIVMAERRCTADEAFAMLSRISQDSNRKLRDVAAALVARAQARDRR
jgi:GAF domain-containing protein